MYQVTWLNGKALHAISTPSVQAARTMHSALKATNATAKLWRFGKTKQPTLLGKVAP